MLDIRNIIIHPGEVYKRVQESEAVASRTVWLVSLVALLAALAGYASSRPLITALPAGSLLRISLPVGAAIAAAGTTIVTWLVKGLLIRVGAGTDSKPWAIAGYSLLPYLAIYLLVALLSLLPANLTAISADPATQTELFQTEFGQISSQLTRGFLGRSARLLGYVGDLWSLVLIFIGTRIAAGTRKAIIAVALVAALVLITDIGSLIAQPF